MKMKIKSNEVKIGVFVFITIAVFVYVTLRAGGYDLYGRMYDFFIKITDIQGLEPNAPVMLNGFEVGSVKGIEIKNEDNKTFLLLHIRVKEDIKIAKDVKVTVKTLGLMGEKYIAMKQDDSQDYIAPYTIIDGDTASDMDDIMNQARKITEKVDLLVTDIRGLVGDLRQAAQNIDGILQENRDELHSIVLNLEGVSRNFDELSAELKKHPWRLLYKK